MKYKKAAMDMTIGELIGWIILGALIIWAVFWLFGLKNIAISIGNRFFK